MDITEAEDAPVLEQAARSGHRMDGVARWQAPAGLLILALSVWPLGAYASRYLYAETIQFYVVAIVVPALLVRGTPWTPRWGRVPLPVALGIDAVFALCCLIWRLPPVLDALAQHPLLRVPELLSALLAGIAVWLQLVNSRSSVVRLTRIQRAGVAAFAMWPVWAIAYAFGFATHPMIHAYDLSGSLGVVADQELSAALMWAISAVCFVSVIAVTMLSWLFESGAPGPGPMEEQHKEARGEVTVRGWARAPRTR